jgi:pSer/pThr/pTyr-binding forkhead associated (FHA) protein
MLTLIVHSEDFPGPLKPNEWDRDVILIGRGEECDAQLKDPSVSQKHASIRQRGNELVLIDEGSANGTFVRAQRLEPGVEHVIRNEDMFRVGEIWLEIRTDDVELVESSAPSTSPPPASPPPVSTTPPPPPTSSTLPPESSHPVSSETAKLLMLRVTKGKDAGKEVFFTRVVGAYFIIGRDGDHCALSLTEQAVSRRHARVTWREGEGMLIQDLGSRNGTFLNGIGGHRVPTDRPVPWKVGTEILLGMDTRVLLVPATG